MLRSSNEKITLFWANAIAEHQATWANPDKLRLARSDSCFHTALLERPYFDQIASDWNSWPTLRRLLAEFRVSRNLSEKNREGRIREFYENMIDVTENWSQLDVVEKAQSIKFVLDRTNETALSAASKLCWFIQPSGWTMFDSRASNAIGEWDFIKFYSILQNLNFETWCPAARKVFNVENSKGIIPERVFDKALYLCGRPTKKTKRITSEHLDLGLQIANMPESSALNRYLDIRGRIQNTASKS